MDTSGVYVIEQIGTDKVYIGSSTRVNNRWYQHRANLTKGKHHSPHLQNAWNKYGPDAFRMYLLEACEPDRDTLIAKEQEYLDAFRPVFNVCPTDGSRLGSKQSPEAIEKVRQVHLGKELSAETKAKMSAAAVGNTNGLGATISPEHRAKLRARMLGHTLNVGRVMPDEVREKISAAQRGKSRLYRVGIALSDETRAKISAAQKGKPRPYQVGIKHSPEAIARSVAGSLGKKRTPEAKAKMSEAARRYFASLTPDERAARFAHRRKVTEGLTR